ncbi:SH3 domain-containing protein [Abyssisolibacter fermentans]|uniref:SH3 domain-containing protein n=1 Tax=Abyssisolibacter fermentans TaxID=1766203 RepID=UPI00083435C4|nr:SH3 domain-containing protein [Abyssisolibacter fermentans]
MKKFLIVFLLVLCCLMIFACSKNDNDIQNVDIGSEEDGMNLDEENKDSNIINNNEKDIMNTKEVEEKKKVKVIVEVLNVREDKTTNSEIISKVYKDSIYEVIDEGKDEQNRIWYKVYSDFGVIGWISSWNCKETNEDSNARIKSEKGELLFIDKKYKDLFLDIILADDYSLNVLIDKYGHDYTFRENYSTNTYEYNNGINIEVFKDGEVSYVQIDDKKIYVNRTKKIYSDIFENDGNEIVVLYEMGLWYKMLVLDSESKDILGNYAIGYLTVDDFQIGDFLNDGKLELYLYGAGDGAMQRDIFKVVDDDFVKVYDINGFDFYRECIKASISNNDLNLDISIGDYYSNEKYVIAERVFYNTKDIEDKNELLSIDSDWNVVKIDNKWYIDITYKVNIIMLEYYWGPPDYSAENNAVMLNDLAKINVFIKLDSGEINIENIDYVIKYDDPNLLNKEPMVYEEGFLIEGPALGMKMEEAYESLGGDKEDFEYTDYFTFNGVEISEFCGEVVSIFVTTDSYKTPRGLKVGDTIEKVESLYGKPDIGFSGDECVEYKSSYEWNNEIQVNFYSGLKIYYENGLVSEYELYQIILD